MFVFVIPLSISDNETKIIKNITIKITVNRNENKKLILWK